MANKDPIILNNWQRGIGNSPHVGFGQMRNVDIHNESGSVLINRKMVQGSPSRVASQTFTANVNDNITFGTSLPALRAVTLTTDDTLPSGLSTGTVYYTISLGTTTKLATSLANAEATTAINITDEGTGTHNIVTVNMGEPTFIVKSPNNGHYWLLDDDGQLWTSRATNPENWYYLDGNNTKGDGEGLVWWRNYVLVFSDTGVTAWGATTSAFASQGWTNSGDPFNTSLTDIDWHTALVGQDDIVYYCNDRNIGSLTNNGTFVGTAATSTFNQSALDLPVNYTSRCLAELGKWLMVGTSNGVTENTMKIADIFPWDRVSGSFELPIRVAEFGIKSMITKGSWIYFLAGVEGRLYRTNKSSVEFLFQIPPFMTKIHENTSIKINLTINPQSLAEHHNKIFMAVGGNNGGDNTSASGVYSLDPILLSLVYEHMISTSSSGGDSNDGTNGVKIPCIMSGSDSYLVIGWDDPNDSNVSGADYTDKTDRYNGSEATVDSPLMIVGTKTDPRTFTDIFIDFTEPLIAGESITIQYRKDQNSSYTTLATFNTVGDVSSQADAGALSDVTILQIRAVLDIDITTANSPKLREIRLI